jgi:hypothetical protein
VYVLSGIGIGMETRGFLAYARTGMARAYIHFGRWGFGVRGNGKKKRGG